jgi:ubiquitin-like 1-activating enzyme E1 B
MLNFCLQAFKYDTEKLLGMEDMWQNRQRPVPLEYDAVAAGTFMLRGEKQGRLMHSVNGAPETSANGGAAPQLKDQRSLTLPESLDLLISRFFIVVYLIRFTDIK